ncbi:hypothetical protein DB88DRAFT_173245 [Papiliotrema laurentii]|uniref:RRM domain-containing protein n=1 Tax=Papiliotrema laurentii TaxID=5418 RepID=A0AAD9FUP2_PAPLA|nr:hypothetical protein DB88DRAFT_173245 [Papiliotrema laurentii]
MPYDNDELYGDDLYKDLDDLDATALEDELVEPDDFDQSQPYNPPQVNPPPASAPVDGANANANAGGPSQPAYSGAGNAFGNAPANKAEDNNEGADRIRPSDMPDEGKMFIGGLNWETTDDGLRAYMAQYGEIDTCVVMRDPSGRSRGFAFLTYKDPASVVKVLDKTHHLDGKQIDPKRAIPRAEHERTAKVFVGGLAPNVTSEGLKEFLSQFGTVMDATVMFDKATTRSKGFAFATFQNEESVQRAMDASGIELQGKQIEIKRAQPRGSGNLPKQFGDVRPTGWQAQPSGGFGGAGAVGGFDPNAMAMMYQNMMKSMGGMGNAPAINPNMARGGMGMGMGMGMGNMMGMMGNNMMGMGGMGGMGMGGMGNMGGMGYNSAHMAGQNAGGRAIPNAPRGPAAMRNPQQGAGGDADGKGPGAQRYSTQGSARSKPY